MNHRNPGPFNGFNFPGTPQPVLLMGNFMSVASAKSAIDKMFHGTSDVTIHGLHLLAGFIIFHYYPYETIVIGMSQPGSFTTSPKYLVRIYKFSIIITLHFLLYDIQFFNTFLPCTIFRNSSSKVFFHVEYPRIHCFSIVTV
jgi:hypothetical protein